jgi:ABC-type multidrug transport system permease subunit
VSLLRIAWGDLRRIGKDRRAVLWALLMPLVLAFVCGSDLFHYNRPTITWIPVVDLDRSDLSRLFIEQMQGEGYWITVTGPREERRLKNGWPWGVVIPAGFGQSVLQGRKLSITVVNGRAPPEALLAVQSRVTHAIARFTKGLARANVSGRAWNDERQTALEESLSRRPLLAVERKRDRSLPPPPDGFNLSLPGFLVMFVLLVITAGGGTFLVRDRRDGQFARLVVAPMSAFEMYAGKTLARIVLGLLQASLLLLGGALLFRMPLGDAPWFVLPVVLCMAVFAGCLSMLCGVICQTEKQVLHVAMFLAVVLAGLGGCWWPIEIVPEFFQRVAALTPSYWCVHGLQRVMYFNKSYEVLRLECPLLLAFAAAVLLVAIPFLNRCRDQAGGS